jgi:hypothetical protein
MSLDYLRTRKGLAYGQKVDNSDVIIVHGDGLPYSQTYSCLISNDDLSSASKGSLYINDITGRLYSKQNSSNIATDWVEAGNEGGASSLEDTYQNPFMGKGSMGSIMPTYQSTYVVSNGKSLASGIGLLDKEIGKSVLTPKNRSVGAISDQAINRNINALDTAIGSNVASTNYVFSNKAVNANVSLLDIALKAANDKIATIETGYYWIDAVIALTASTLSGRTGLSPLGDDESIHHSFLVGERVVSQAENTIYTAQTSTWSLITALHIKDAFFTEYTFTDPANQEKGSAWTYTIASSLTKIADFDFEMANEINLTGGYVKESGTIAPSDTVQEAIAKLDFNQSNIITTVGVAIGDSSLGVFTGNIISANNTVKGALQQLSTKVQYNNSTLSSHLNSGLNKHKANQIAMSSPYAPSNGAVTSADTVQLAISKTDGNILDLTSVVGVSSGAVNLGAWTGAGATDILNSTETTKTAIQKLANEIGSAVTANDYITDQPVNRNIQSLSAGLLDTRKVLTNSVTAGNTIILDTLAAANFVGLDYSMAFINGTSTAKRLKNNFQVLISTTGIDFVETNVLVLPSKQQAPKVSISASINGSNVEILVTSKENTDTINIKAIREVIRM